MIDIETLSVRANAAIVDIGACTPDGKCFSAYINPAAYDTEPFSMDQKTIEWHMETNSDNWNNYINSKMFNVEDALDLLSKFLSDVCPDKDNLIVWAKGPQFDLTILDHAHRIYNRPLPWKYYNVRDFRTVASMFPDIVEEVAPNTNKHGGLSDAIHQLKCLERVYNHLGLELE